MTRDPICVAIIFAVIVILVVIVTIGDILEHYRAQKRSRMQIHFSDTMQRLIEERQANRSPSTDE